MVDNEDENTRHENNQALMNQDKAISQLQEGSFEHVLQSLSQDFIKADIADYHQPKSK